MEKIIEINNLSKSYGKINAVNNLNLSIEKGSFFSLLGENGAGKSTTVNILSTLISKDTGEIKIAGFFLGKDDRKIKEKIGVIFQKSMMDGLLTVKENLLLRGSLYGKHSKKEILMEINKSLSLEDILNRPYNTLSGGQKRKVDIARALMGRPEILFLDEPTTGLDPSIRKDVWEIIDNLRKITGLTIFLTTHYMEEAAKSDHIAIIGNGNLLAEGTPQYLKKTYSKERVCIKTHDFNKAEDFFKEHNINFKRNHNNFELYPHTPEEILDTLYPIKECISEISIIDSSLDDVFLNIVKGNQPNEIHIPA
jgi:multidrug/hemolysin transport system ATP-binding protein